MASFDSLSGARTGYQFYQGIAEIGFYGPGPTQGVARVRGVNDVEYRLGAVAPDTLLLTTSSSVLADEGLGSRTWLRGPTMFRSRAAPDNTLEAYDLATLAERLGWAAPVVPSLADLEVVGARVFLAGGTVNGVVAAQPAALALATGAIDATWQPPALAKRTPDPSGTPYVPTSDSARHRRAAAVLQRRFRAGGRHRSRRGGRVVYCERSPRPMGSRSARRPAPRSTPRVDC